MKKNTLLEVVSWSFCANYRTAILRSSHQRCSRKKLFLKISQTSQSNSCQNFFFIAGRPATLLKKKLWDRCFRVNFAKCFRKPLLQNTCEGLLCRTIANYSAKCYFWDFQYFKYIQLWGQHTISGSVNVWKKINNSLILNFNRIILAHNFYRK